MKNKGIITKIILIIVIILLLSGIAYIGYTIYEKLTTDIPNPVATIEVQDFGTIKIELYPDQAPNTVANFIRLANRGFYDGLTFHRTIPDFMIQGGDVDGDGTGSPTLSDILDDGSTTEDYSIEGEFIANGDNDNKIQFTRGVIAMARSDYTSISSSLTEESYNSAGSQFFIMQADNTSLNGIYAAFGEVIEGMDVVDEIANVEVVTRDSSESEGVDQPVDPPVITSISVETYGVDYGEPETVEPFNYYNWLMQYYTSSTTDTE